jgi:CRP/FNR family transcriptional regulator
MMPPSTKFLLTTRRAGCIKQAEAKGLALDGLRASLQDVCLFKPNLRQTLGGEKDMDESHFGSGGRGRSHRHDGSGGTSSVKKSDEVEGVSQSKAHPAATRLFRQGAPADEVYIIDDGVVKLTRLEEHGEVIMGLRRREWVLGAAAVLLEQPYAATAITVTPCQMRRMSARNFRHLMKTNPEFSWQVHLMHSREVYDQMAGMVKLACLSARQRLEHFLWESISAQDGAEPHTPIWLQSPLKHLEIAQLIVVTPEHLSRLLKELEQDGLLRRQKGWVIIQDPRKLWHLPDVISINTGLDLDQ